MKRQTLETYRERILRVLVHVQSHLDEPLALPDLAAVAHFSPYHFHRIFSGQWLPTSGEEARSAPALEFYRNSPMDTPPEKLLTDVCMPVG